jgi:hypothetical protein
MCNLRTYNSKFSTSDAKETSKWPTYLAVIKVKNLPAYVLKGIPT